MDKKKKIAIVASNLFRIEADVGRGPEVFVYILTNQLAKNIHRNNIQFTVFSSGDSRVPFPVESVDYKSSLDDINIGIKYHKLMELSLLSKAFSQQDRFELYHINIGNGEITLPFLPFVKKPIIVTLHSSFFSGELQKFYKLYAHYSNIYYVSISNNQRTKIPELNYIKTIYHGIDTNNFIFSDASGDSIMWAGRASPQKGLDVVLKVANTIKKETMLYILDKEENKSWVDKLIESNKTDKIKIEYRVDRKTLISQYCNAKLFLFPIQWEEPFGLVMVESMACGTPVVAYARGSVPEVIKDGETGFIVNSSPDDVRGDWIVKKTGIDGLCEAVEKIYSIPEEQYKQMRRNCRAQVEKNFTVERMVEDYEKVYEQILNKT